MARPKRVFTDKEVAQIYSAALDNCHMDTIALALDIPKTTLVRSFGTIIKQLRAEGRVNLRSNQARLSKVSSDMAKFLGKNELGQVDKQTVVDEKPPVAIPEAEQEAVNAAADTYKLHLA